MTLELRITAILFLCLIMVSQLGCAELRTRSNVGAGLDATQFYAKRDRWSGGSAE